MTRIIPENTQRLNVAVLFGGASAERNVSIASGAQVARGLEAATPSGAGHGEGKERAGGLHIEEGELAKFV